LCICYVKNGKTPTGRQKYLNPQTDSSISTTTAFAWRHKIIEAMKDYQEVVQLSGEIEID